MKRVFKTEKFLFLLLLLISGILFSFIHNRVGNLYIDCGREAYIPLEILKGEVLYKDIFNIYAPASYLFNALLFKIFSPSLNILYISGGITFLGIISTLYLISRFFLSVKNSFIILFSIILISMISFNVFNFFFPYSYAMIYGLLAILISIYFLLRRRSDFDYYLAALFAGLAVINKYEFIPYIIPLFFWVIKDLRTPLKLLKSLGCYILFPVLSFLILFLQGLDFSDISKEIVILSEIMKSQTFKYFYEITGVKFSIAHIPLIFMSAALFVATFLIMSFRRIPNYMRVLIVVGVCFLISKTLGHRFFVFVPFLILGLFLYRYKNLNSKVKILVCSYLAISLKVFSSLMLYSYGMYYIGLSILVLAIILPIRLRQKYVITVFLIVLYMFLGALKGLANKNIPIITEKGTIYSSKYQANPFIEVYQYLKANTLPEDRILCFPEEPLLNFVLDRKSDNYLYSLIPMYIETFGEGNIIQRLQETNPEYIILNAYDTSSYVFRKFGEDYALGIKRYIEDNYKVVYETKEGLKHKIYRRK